jgi:hypothetical protein
MTPPLWPWTAMAVPVVVVGGVLLHFVFVWSGKNRLMAVFAPVNESLWEHLKMAYLPLVAYTVVELIVTSAPAGLGAARAAGFAVTAVSMLALSGALTATSPPTGLRGQLIQDGAVFVIAVALGAFASHGVLGYVASVPAPIAAALLSVPAIVFAVTTFAPPHARLFEDQVTGGYGIPAG